MLISIIAALVIAILAVIFTLLNWQVVTVSFLFWKVDSSLALVLLITLAVGLLISLLAYLPGFIRGKLYVSNQRKKLAALETERNSFKQKAEEAQKAVKSLEEQVANLSAELEKRQTSPTPPQPPATTQSVETYPQPSAITQFPNSPPPPVKSQSPETGYPVNHTN